MDTDCGDGDNDNEIVWRSIVHFCICCISDVTPGKETVLLWICSPLPTTLVELLISAHNFPTEASRAKCILVARGT